MRYLNPSLAILITVSLCCEVSIAQSGGMTNGSASVVDGAITLTGEFLQLGGIQAQSTAGHLSLNTIDAAGVGSVQQKTPFSLGDGVVVQDLPQEVVIGVLGAQRRIDLSGATTTAILYSASQEVAANGDLNINVALGDCTSGAGIGIGTPTTLSCIGGRYVGDGGVDGGGTGGDGNIGGGGGGNTGGGGTDGGGGTVDPFIGRVTGGSASVAEGFVTLHGKFEGLAAIETKSRGGFLSLESTLASNDVEVPLTTPFPSGSAVIANRPSQVTIGVLGKTRRISVEGSTRTAIRYSESSGIASNDLTVAVGLADCPVLLPMDDSLDFTCSGKPGGNWTDGGGNTVGGDAGGGDAGGGDAGELRSGHFTDVYATIVDGRIVLAGEFEGLAGIQATSIASHLSVEQLNAPDIGEFSLSTPFDGGVVAVNRPNQAVVGSLGRENRVNSADSLLTDTSMLYAGSMTELANGDLSIEVGIGDCPPVALGIDTPSSFTCKPPEPIAAEGDFTLSLVDGVLTINGTVTGLTSVGARSNGEFLSIEQSPDSTELTGPFPINSRVRAEPSITGINSVQPIDISGVTHTSIRYTESPTVAEEDLRVFVTLDTCSFLIPLDTAVTATCNDGVRAGGFVPEVKAPQEFDLVDGSIQIHGDYEDITSITITSAAGLLSFDPAASEAIDSTLFGEGKLELLNNDANSISFATATTADGFAFDGVHGTGILYAAHDEATLFSDLVISVGFGDAVPITLPLATQLIPEPSSALSCLIGLLVTFAMRSKRHKR